MFSLQLGNKSVMCLFQIMVDCKFTQSHSSPVLGHDPDFGSLTSIIKWFREGGRDLTLSAYITYNNFQILDLPRP